MKKILPILMSALMLTFSMASCGTKPQDSSSQSSNPQSSTPSSSTAPSSTTPSDKSEDTAEPTAVTIKVANWDTDNLVYVKQIIEDFKDVAPHITVEIIDIPAADYTTKLSVMLNGGSEVDAFWIKDGDTTRGLADKGQLADLTDYIARDGINLSDYSGLAERFEMNGEIVALPASTGFYVLYYNKDIFDAANEPYPSNDMTWAQWEELCKRLTSDSDGKKVYGGHLHTWQALVQNWAVQDGQHTIVDTDYSFMKPYYEMALRLQDDGYIMDYATIQAGSIGYNGAFMDGMVATMPMGTWSMATLITKKAEGETDVNWGVATIPHPENVSAGYTVGSVTPIAINSSSKNKDEAWEFIKYVTSEEGAKSYAEHGAFPSRSNDETVALIASLEGMPEDAEDALQVKNIALDRPMESLVGEINQMLGEEHSMIMLEESTVDEGIAEMNKRTAEIQGLE